jgi:transcriptional regulator GlxA family with amidase domain
MDFAGPAEVFIVTQHGKIITTAGVTAGIDGALHIVECLLGKEAIRWTAQEWMEHPHGETTKKP